MLVALRLVEGPTVLSLTDMPVPGCQSPEGRAIQSALDCVLDDDMHVLVDTSWGRAVFKLREDDPPWLGLFPRVTIYRHTQGERPEISCTMGAMARDAAWNCLHVLHPDAWTVAGGNIRGSPAVLRVAVVVERRHQIWSTA